VTAPSAPTFSFDPELKRKLLFTALALLVYRPARTSPRRA